MASRWSSLEVVLASRSISVAVEFPDGCEAAGVPSDSMRTGGSDVSAVAIITGERSTYKGRARKRPRSKELASRCHALASLRDPRWDRVIARMRDNSVPGHSVSFPTVFARLNAVHCVLELHTRLRPNWPQT